jgi:hypothetical protein
MNKLYLVIIFILLLTNIAIAKTTTLPKTQEPQIFKYEHIFPPTKEPKEQEKKCTGLDALDPECLNIEIQKEAEQQQDKKK